MTSIEKKAKGILNFINELELPFEKENYIYEQLGAMQENGETDLLIAMAEGLMENEEGTSLKFSSSLRMRLLYQLVTLTTDKIIAIEELETRTEEDELDRSYLYNKLYNYMWYFKWIVPALGDSLNTTKDMIDSANEMMEYYYNNLEISLAMYYKSLMLQNIEMGDVELAKENFKLWQEIENDDFMSDCEACEVTEKVNYYSFIGEYEKALEEAEPILSGKLSCAEVPHITYAPVLKSMVSLKRFDEVKKLLPTAVKLIDGSLDLVSHIIPLIEVSYKVGDVDYAKELAEKYEEKILNQTDEINALKFFIATSVLDDENYEKALTAVKLFDERNENSYYADYLAKYKGEDKKIIKFFS